MTVRVERVEQIDGGEQVRVTVDSEGNSIVWMLKHLITSEGAIILGEALAANRAYYDRRAIPRHLTQAA